MIRINEKIFLIAFLLALTQYSSVVAAGKRKRGSTSNDDGLSCFVEKAVDLLTKVENLDLFVSNEKGQGNRAGLKFPSDNYKTNIEDETDATAAGDTLAQDVKNILTGGEYDIKLNGHNRNQVRLGIRNMCTAVYIDCPYFKKSETNIGGLKILKELYTSTLSGDESAFTRACGNV